MTVRLLASGHRAMIGSWSLLIVTLCGGTPWAYQDTYAGVEEQAAAVREARSQTAATLLNGELFRPGTPAQMFAWEIGGIVTVLVAVFAVQLAVAVTRATDDDGTAELVRSCGVPGWRLLVAATAVPAAVAGALTVACTVAVGSWTGRVGGITWPGAVAFAATLGLTFLLIAATTVLLAQAAWTATAARLYGLAAVAVAFVVRAIADVGGVPALNWLSPLALRSTARPFTGDRWWPLPLYAVSAAGLIGLAVMLSQRREFGAGLGTRAETRDRRLPVRGPIHLRLLLVRRSTAIWTAAVAALTALFTATGSGVVEQSRHSELGGFLGAQLGGGDPVSAYCVYTATVVALPVGAYAILQVLACRGEEESGRIAVMLAAGVHRVAPLLAHLAAALAGSAVMLVTAATTGALIASATMGGNRPGLRLFCQVAGQWPVVAAMAAGAALLIGLAPRAAAIVWALPVAAGTLALLGPLLGMPPRVLDLSPLQQVPDPVTPAPEVNGLLVLIAVAATAAIAGAAGVARQGWSR